jgi:hypothetical protein
MRAAPAASRTAVRVLTCRPAPEPIDDGPTWPARPHNLITAASYRGHLPKLPTSASEAFIKHSLTVPQVGQRDVGEPQVLKLDDRLLAEEVIDAQDYDIDTLADAVRAAKAHALIGSDRRLQQTS